MVTSWIRVCMEGHLNLHIHSLYTYTPFTHTLPLHIHSLFTYTPFSSLFLSSNAYHSFFITFSYSWWHLFPPPLHFRFNYTSLPFHRLPPPPPSLLLPNNALELPLSPFINGYKAQVGQDHLFRFISALQVYKRGLNQTSIFFNLISCLFIFISIYNYIKGGLIRQVYFWA